MVLAYRQYLKQASTSFICHRSPAYQPDSSKACRDGRAPGMTLCGPAAASRFLHASAKASACPAPAASLQLPD
jgi:hypothetical protein